MSDKYCYIGVTESEVNLCHQKQADQRQQILKTYALVFLDENLNNSLNNYCNNNNIRNNKQFCIYG